MTGVHEGAAQRYPFREMLGFAASCLHWSADEFWNSTPHDWHWAWKAWAFRNGVLKPVDASMTKDWLERLKTDVEAAEQRRTGKEAPDESVEGLTGSNQG